MAMERLDLPIEEESKAKAREWAQRRANEKNESVALFFVRAGVYVISDDPEDLDAESPIFSEYGLAVFDPEWSEARMAEEFFGGEPPYQVDETERKS